MQPHTVALINLLSYLRQGSKKGDSFTSWVTYKRDGSPVKKIYDIKVYKQNDSQLSGSISSRQLYSCQFNIQISGRSITIRHGHDPVTERFNLSSSQITGGSISSSRIGNGSFSGYVRSGGRNVTVNATTTGSKYESRIS